MIWDDPDLDVSWTVGDTTSATPQLLLVRCGKYSLGFRAETVQWLVTGSEIVPFQSKGVVGLVWCRGVLSPVISLHPQLGLAAPADPIVGHGVILKAGEGSICVMVDEALDLIAVPPESTAVLPRLVSQAASLSHSSTVVLRDPIALIVDPLQVLGTERVDELLSVAAHAANPAAA